MTKEEIKELQNNLISLVPSDIRKSKELTKSDKILLGQLVYLFRMDKAKANGYVFRSNDDLENDTQLSSQTIRFSINRLIKFGAINRTAGSRAEGASIYTLNFEMNGDEITPKITPKNHPYMTKDEVEALIEGLRADYQKQINDLRNEIAELKGVKSDETTPKSPLKITPIPTKITPQIQITDIETTNHSDTIGLDNYRVDASKTDEGDKAIFNKIEGRVETSQPDEETTIDYLTNLEKTLRNEETNLNTDEVIALSNELNTILNKWGQSSNVGKLTINRSANLINWFVDDLTTLEGVRDILASHLRQDNGNLRPQPTRNVNARAAYFRGNFVNLVGSNAGIVTGEIGKIHRKDAGQR